jgi:hypothetical protein
MSHRTELTSFPLASVAQRCEQETDRFFRRQLYDPWFCFELFRRAIVDQCQRAWECIYAQYQVQVTGWVRKHAAFSSSGEEVSYLVNRTFERMWGALTPEKFARFDTLPALLRYLQMCVHSVLLDLVRAVERAGVVSGIERPERVGERTAPAVETLVLDRAQREAFWQAICARLKNDKERWVVYGLYVMGYKPRELYAQHSDRFRSIDEVYRVRENLIARLRRDADLANSFGWDA